MDQPKEHAAYLSAQSQDRNIVETCPERGADDIALHVLAQRSTGV